MRNDSERLTVGDSPSDFFRNIPDSDAAAAAQPPTGGEAPAETVEQTRATLPDSDAAPRIDPSAETIAEDFPPLPLPLARTEAASSVPVVNSAPAAPRQRASLLLIVLISYASAATLALLYLCFALSRPRPHALESLPDVPPLDVQHGEVMKLAPADAGLPPGHRLALGESRRFGNVLIEPLRVVAEPVTFEHFSTQSDVQKPPTQPVLKLWVRFTNVSDNQTIAPLDPDLLYRRALLDDGVPRSNQFVCRTSEQADPAALILMYDHPPTSEWDLSEQKLGVKLGPGESIETYLPSGEEGPSLSGPLVWRVHFRKGFSPLGHGVTTLVDVVFESTDVDSAAPGA
ncbi:MAG: hypothetical protein JNG89_19085 [Planctomycetaceae bacterium]|nr:hypothetical protein [Planctomycetaceae bacterium]